MVALCASRQSRARELDRLTKTIAREQARLQPLLPEVDPLDLQLSWNACSDRSVAVENSSFATGQGGMSCDEIFLEALIAALRRVELEAVVVGITASILHGAPVLTQDVERMIAPRHSICVRSNGFRVRSAQPAQRRDGCVVGRHHPIEACSRSKKELVVLPILEDALLVQRALAGARRKCSSL